MPKQEKLKNNNSVFTFFCKKNNAYTLIEVVAVIGIIGILAVLSWVTLGTSKKDVTVDGACNQAAAMINKARGYALSGKVVGGGTPPAFTVSFSGAGSSMSITPGLTGDNLTFQNGVKCTGGPFTFSVPTGSCPSCSSATIDCYANGTSKHKTIKVSKFSAVCE